MMFVGMGPKTWLEWLQKRITAEVLIDGTMSDTKPVNGFLICIGGCCRINMEAIICTRKLWDNPGGRGLYRPVVGTCPRSWARSKWLEGEVHLLAWSMAILEWILEWESEARRL